MKRPISNEQQCNSTGSISTKIHSTKSIDNSTVAYNSDNYDHMVNLLTLHPGYILQPTIQQIISNKMKCDNLRICYQNTEILWTGLIDLSALKLPLRHLIILGEDYVQVYPTHYDQISDNSFRGNSLGDSHCSSQYKKPGIGQQLNKKCIAKFRVPNRVNCSRLASACSQQNNCQLLSVSNDGHQFMIEIPHFTKYKFENVFDEGNNQQSQDDKITANNQDYNMQTTESLATFLTDKYLHLISKDNQQMLHNNYQSNNKQTILAILENSYNNSNYYKVIEAPSRLIGEVCRYNTHTSVKNYMLVDSNISGINNPYGSNASFASLNLPGKKQYIYLINNKPINTRYSQLSLIDSYQLIIKLIDKPSNINKYIFDEKIHYRVRQCLVLFCICFRYYCCQFKLTRNPQTKRLYLEQSYSNRKHKDNKNFNRTQLLKDCIQWIICTAHQNNKIKTHSNVFYEYLGLRRNQQFSMKLLQFDRYEEAEFVSNIEDQYYRHDRTNSCNLSTELLAILNNDFIMPKNNTEGNQQNSLHWLMQYGMLLWYYNYDSKTFHQKVTGILQSQKHEKQFQIQLYLLRLFYEQTPSHARLPVQSNPLLNNLSQCQQNGGYQQYLLGWKWYFSNNLTRQQQHFYGIQILQNQTKQDKSRLIRGYNKQRYCLLNRLIQNCVQEIVYQQQTRKPVRDRQYLTLRQIILHQNYLPLSHKQKILENLLKKHRSSQIQFNHMLVGSQETMISNQIIVKKSQAINYYNQGNYLEALNIIATIYHTWAAYFHNYNNKKLDQHMNLQQNNFTIKIQEFEAILIQIISRQELLLCYIPTKSLQAIGLTKQILKNISSLLITTRLKINSHFLQYLEDCCQIMSIKLCLSNGSQQNINAQMYLRLLDFANNFQSIHTQNQLFLIIYEHLHKNRQIINFSPQNSVNLDKMEGVQNKKRIKKQRSQGDRKPDLSKIKDILYHRLLTIFQHDKQKILQIRLSNIFH